jgi:hypothetical protein
MPTDYFPRLSPINEICLFISGHGCDKGKLFKHDKKLYQLAQNNVEMLSETVHDATNVSINEETQLEEITSVFRNQRQTMNESANRYREQLQQKKYELLVTEPYQEAKAEMYNDISLDAFHERLYDINYLKSLMAKTHCQFIKPEYEREYDFIDKENPERMKNFGIYILYSCEAGQENNVYYNYLDKMNIDYDTEKEKEKLSNSLVNTTGDMSYIFSKASTNHLSNKIYFYKKLYQHLCDKKKVLLSDVLELLLVDGLFERIIIIDTACRKECDAQLTRALTRRPILSEHQIRLYRRNSSFGLKKAPKKSKKVSKRTKKVLP